MRYGKNPPPSEFTYYFGTDIPGLSTLHVTLVFINLLKNFDRTSVKSC